MTNQKKGTITIIAFFSLGILLLLSVYFLSFALAESKISRSQEAGTRAYYLAEAGINEAIWKLKNDETWKSDFIDPDKNPDGEGNYWSATFELSDEKKDILGGTYIIKIQNSARGRGRITSEAAINLDGKTAQRVIKTTAFKSLAGPPEAAIFAGGKELKIKRSLVEVHGGNIYSNEKLKIEDFSNVKIYSLGGNALFAGCDKKGKELKIGKSDVRVYDGNIFSNGDLKIEKNSTVEVNNGSGNALFAGCKGKAKELKIKDSSVKIGEPEVDGANIFSNEKIKIEGSSTYLEVNDDPDTIDDPETLDIIENLEGMVFAVDKLEFKHGAGDSNLTVEAVCVSGRCDSDCPTECPPPPEALEPTVSVPMVDFDSDYPECNPPLHSFKCRAQAAEDLASCEVLCNGSPCTSQPEKCIYSESEFENLLWEIGKGGTLTLNNEITYVDKNVELRGDRHLVVNGALVAKDIKIGNKWEWKEHGEPTQYGDSSVTVCEASQADYITDCTTWCRNHPCGLLAKKKVEFGKYSFFWHDIDITGILYAIEEIKIISILQEFDIKGAIIGGKVKIESKIHTWFDITYDKDIMLYGLGWKPEPPQFSPIINIEHWEETY